MAVRIYSTLTGREDELVPLHPDGVLRMYVCGMTPKFHPHLGHARLFVAMDVIRRYLIFRGHRLKYVQNFTDVDDKIIQRAQTIFDDPEAAKYVWGIGFHWYEDWSGGQQMYGNVELVSRLYPDKHILFTEGTPARCGR